MHQYCLLNSACYIINTHWHDMDMIWQGYQRRRVRKRVEGMHFSWTAEFPSQSSRHDVSVSQTKRGTEGRREKICCCMTTNLGFHMQSPSYRYVCISAHTPRVWLWSDIRFPHGHQILSKKKKKNCKFNITSSHLFTSTDVSTSDGLWRYCSCWYLIKVKAGFL